MLSDFFIGVFIGVVFTVVVLLCWPRMTARLLAYSFRRDDDGGKR